ncbi:hypothetical protein SH668x_000478 [Planctomicrobium sp. SH668]|uniref:hypothetical protein n=1 Tax=Planctomicrobium sp. SH668 TaxID=3448126 RepID=UPI003F5C4295
MRKSGTLSRHRNWRYLLIDQGLIAIFVNFGINWAIAWTVFRNEKIVPVAGELSVESDTVSTCWMLPLISCVIVSLLTRQEINKGRLAAFAPFPVYAGVSPVLRQSLLLRAALWGTIGWFVVAPLAIQVLKVLVVDDLPLQTFLLIKSLFAAVLGLIFCPLHAWIAFYDTPSK